MNQGSMADSKGQIPMRSGARRRLRQARWLFRRVTHPVRRLPDFLIIGAQRCGTTSLYRYLEEHPGVSPAFEKEIHFFDIHHHRGISWYRAFFPTSFHRLLPGHRFKGPRITGEASPYYFFHPRVPGRVFETVPSARLLLVLRNPVDRAYSQYHHERRLGFEDLPTFEEALDLEARRLAGEHGKMAEDPGYVSLSHIHHAYLTRGIYVKQLESWRRYFPREQFLILRSEDFCRETPSVFRQVLDFLNLPHLETDRYPFHNRSVYPEMDPDLRRRLIEFFRPHNRELYRYLGRDLGWDG